MIEEKTTAVGFEKGDVLHDHVEEKKGEGENCCRGGFHVEAAEHERQTQNGAAFEAMSRWDKR